MSRGNLAKPSGFDWGSIPRKRPRPLRLLTAFASTSPKGRGLGKEMNLRGLPRALPLGELAL